MLTGRFCRRVKRGWLGPCVIGIQMGCGMLFGLCCVGWSCCGCVMN